MPRGDYSLKWRRERRARLAREKALRAPPEDRMVRTAEAETRAELKERLRRCAADEPSRWIEHTMD